MSLEEGGQLEQLIMQMYKRFWWHFPTLPFSHLFIGILTTAYEIRSLVLLQEGRGAGRMHTADFIAGNWAQIVESYSQEDEDMPNLVTVPT